jgi:hypothetical protein
LVLLPRWSELADPVRRWRLIKRLLVLVALLVVLGCVSVLGNARLGRQTDDLTADLRADLAELDVGRVERDGRDIAIVAPPDPHTYFPRAGDRMVGSWQSAKAASFWFEVRLLGARRCVQVGLHDSGYTFDVFTPGQRVCGSGPV